MEASNLNMHMVNELMEGMNITSQRENGCLCRPVIINISKTYWGISAKKRPSASRDEELLLETFKNMGFADPYIISDRYSHLEEDPLYSVENLGQELQKIARTPAHTKDAEKFFLAVLAFGEFGYFYLPNTPKNDYQERERNPPKFSTSLLMSHFNGINCSGLIKKPKIFCVQTCSYLLKQKDRSEFTKEITRPEENRIPIEADLLLYHSTISGGYTDKMTSRGALGGVIDQEGDHPACQFVYSLHKAVRMLVNELGEFHLYDLILRVNLLLEEFIDKEHYMSDIRNQPWNIDPVIPICVDQLTNDVLFGTKLNGPS